MKTRLPKPNGFTIIEVMIVLSIAGVIMSIVFLAVPQLERSQRDSQRKSLALRVKSELEIYASNNQGIYPFNGPGGAPTPWTDCSQSPSGGASHTCYDWFTNQLSADKVNLADPSCSGNDTIYYGSDNSSNYLPPHSSWTCAGGGFPNIQPGTMFIAIGEQCAGGSLSSPNSAFGTASSNQYAVLTALENSGSWFCVDNR